MPSQSLAWKQLKRRTVPQLQLFTFGQKEEAQKFLLEHIQSVSRATNLWNISQHLKPHLTFT